MGRGSLLRLALALGLLIPPSSLSAAPFIRGDVNFDGLVDISDAIGQLSYLFLGEEGPGACEDAVDTNDDGINDVSDPIFTLAFLFTGASEIPAPQPDCGTDPTEDALGCEASWCPDDIECFGRPELDALIQENVQEFICLQSPLLSTSLLGNTIEVCPLGTSVCRAGGQGCEFVVETVTATVDLGAQIVRVELTGNIASIIFRVDSLLGETDCDISVEVDGAAELDFRGREVDGGFEVTSVGATLVDAESTVITLGSNDDPTPLICSLIVGAEEAVQEQVIAELEGAIDGLIAEFAVELLGQVLCEDI